MDLAKTFCSGNPTDSQPHSSPAPSPSGSTSHSPQASTAPQVESGGKLYPWPGNPFDPNYRYICYWSAERKADWIETWPIGMRPDFWEVFESAERAEYVRPHDQLDFLLRERGLEDAYNKIMRGEGTVEERRERARELLRNAGEPELVERAENIWRLGDGRRPVFQGESAVEDLLEKGDVAGYRWIMMNPDRIPPRKGKPLNPRL